MVGAAAQVLITLFVLGGLASVFRAMSHRLDVLPFVAVCVVASVVLFVVAVRVDAWWHHRRRALPMERPRSDAESTSGLADTAVPRRS